MKYAKLFYTPIEEDGEVLTELRIMQTPAGFYLGRNLASGAPYSRQTDYYRLNSIHRALLEYPDTRRDCIENKDIYMLEDEMIK